MAHQGLDRALAPALKATLDAWFDEVKRAHWASTAGLKRLYASASIVAADRIVFNIKGNDCRLVVAVGFEKGLCGSSGSAPTRTMTGST